MTAYWPFWHTGWETLIFTIIGGCTIQKYYFIFLVNFYIFKKSFFLMRLNYCSFLNIFSLVQIVKKDVYVDFNETITFIDIKDQYQDGNGGYASLLNGGPGNKDVTMHFKSQRNHGFNFIVEIFGKRSNKNLH